MAKKSKIKTIAQLIKNYYFEIIFIAIVALCFIIYVVESEKSFKFGPLEIGSKQLKTKELVPSINSVKIDGKQNIYGNGNTVIDNSVINSKNDQQNEYSILGSSNQNLIKQITDKSKIKVVNSSHNRIEITYTGTIALLEKNSNTFYYSGGHLAILIDQSMCYEFDEFKIDEMRPNSKNQILSEIQSSIDKYVNSNTGLFSKKIIECLKN